MKAFKGFDKNLRCDPTGNKPFQYEIGGTYEEESAVVCENGFHACENPIDVLTYYPPAEQNRYCEVELDGVSKKENGDTKMSGTKIQIGMEVGIKGIIQGALHFILERTRESADTTATTGYGAHAATTGDDAHAEVKGKNSIAAAFGINSRAKGSIDSYIVCSEWKEKSFAECILVGVRAAKVDGVNILPDVFYELKDGEFVIAEK